LATSNLYLWNLRKQLYLFNANSLGNEISLSFSVASLAAVGINLFLKHKNKLFLVNSIESAGRY
jgi:hypothetical protein